MIVEITDTTISDLVHITIYLPYEPRLLHFRKILECNINEQDKYFVMIFPTQCS